MFDEENSYDLKVPVINKIFILKAGIISAMASPIEFSFKVLDQFSFMDNFLINKTDIKTNEIKKRDGKSLLINKSAKITKRVQRSSSQRAPNSVSTKSRQPSNRTSRTEKKASTRRRVDTANRPIKRRGDY
tara:strand:- start:102 stop:494 length:393 start_codon:yes stop_codon:yes gene_type:complete